MRGQLAILVDRHLRGDAALGRKAERWRRIASAAAEQSHRRIVPQIDTPCRYADLPWAELPGRLLLLDPGAEKGGWEQLEPGRSAVGIMVGPEGGWSRSEVEAAVAHGVIAVPMGPRILRADTAGVVAIVLLQQRFGDLG